MAEPAAAVVINIESVVRSEPEESELSVKFNRVNNGFGHVGVFGVNASPMLPLTRKNRQASAVERNEPFIVAGKTERRQIGFKMINEFAVFKLIQSACGNEKNGAFAVNADNFFLEFLKFGDFAVNACEKSFTRSKINRIL